MTKVLTFLILCSAIACGNSNSKLDPNKNLACVLVKSAVAKADCYPLFSDAGSSRTYTARVVLPDESQILVSYSLMKPLELEVKGFQAGKNTAAAAPAPVPATPTDAGSAAAMVTPAAK